MRFPVFASGLALASLTAAQTSTKCNPLTSSKLKATSSPEKRVADEEQGCPANPGLNSESYSIDFTQGADSAWTGTTAVGYSSKGAALTVGAAYDSPSLYSNFYFLFGRVEAKIQAAPGVGIVSSLVLLSDDLDEVDYEWLGGNPQVVQTNYFGKGNTTTYDRELDANVAAATTTFHTYAIRWTSSAITWSIDNNPVRTLNYADAVGGHNFPQTPCRVGFGVWPAGASSAEGTRKWAGGSVDFSQGPFTMYTQSISIVNYNPADSYLYGDQSGSYQSIQVTGGKSSSIIGSGSNNNANANANQNSGSSSTSTQSPSPRTSTSTTASSSTAATTTTTTVTNNTFMSQTSSAASSMETSTSSSMSSAQTSHMTSTSSRSSSATTSSAASSPSPSDAPSAASTTTLMGTKWVWATLTSILAFAFGMGML